LDLQLNEISKDVNVVLTNLQLSTLKIKSKNISNDTLLAVTAQSNLQHLSIILPNTDSLPQNSTFFRYFEIW